jgi:hypothetical protein
VTTATPATLPVWFEPYTRWRFIGLPREFPGSLAKYPRPAFPHRITLVPYGWVLDEWDRFALWSAWIDAGRSGPRPAGLWTNAAGKAVSPTWAVRTRRLILSYRKPLPPFQPLPFPPPDPHPMPDVSFGRNWICMAQEPTKALWYPARFGIAFTADPAYEKPSFAQLAEHIKRGQRIAVWCDCHSTFPDQADHVRKQLNADLVIGEGESAAAFQVALDAGLRMAWINISALTGAQKDAIRDGAIITPNELYLNQDSSRADRENWENLPIPGRLIACYDASGEASTGRRFAFDEYVHLGKWSPTVDSFYDPGATDQDRRGIV